jgi:DNA helicase II / ATP-dependent DNA helicase PcrA
LAYGQLICRAVAELGKPDVAGNVHAALEHLIVDEYQDVSPAQERLIRLLTGPQVELCVTGDDDHPSSFRYRRVLAGHRGPVKRERQAYAG